MERIPKDTDLSPDQSTLWYEQELVARIRCKPQETVNSMSFGRFFMIFPFPNKTESRTKQFNQPWIPILINSS